MTDSAPSLPPVTVRQLIEQLAAMPDLDAPVVLFVDGQKFPITTASYVPDTDSGTMLGRVGQAE